MNLLKKLFKTEKPRPEFAPDEELVEAIRTVMGDHVADQVRGRMAERAEYDADIAALENELEGMAERANNYIQHANQIIKSLEDECFKLFGMLSEVGGHLPVDACGKFCVNGYPGQCECPYDSKPDFRTSLRCANFYADSEWEKVLSDRRAFLLRKRDNNQLTDDEKDELIRSLDTGKDKVKEAEPEKVVAE